MSSIGLDPTCSTKRSSHRLGSRSVMWLAFGWLLFIYSVSVFLGHPQWAVNDDLGMAWIASGQYSGSPDQHLIFVSVVLGLPLKALYTIFPEVAWYTLAQVSTVIGSCLAALWLLRRSRFAIIGWVLTATPLCIFLSQRPNFTVTSIICVSVGILYLADFSLNQSSLSRSWRLFSAGSFLTYVGSLWRFDGLALAFVVMSPVVLFSVVHRNSGLLAVTKRAAVFLLPVLLILAISAMFNNSCLFEENCGAWNSFNDYNSVRGSLQGTDRMIFLNFIKESVGLGPNGFLLFNGFANFDSPVFGVEMIRRAGELTPIAISLPTGGLRAFVFESLEQLTYLVPFLVILLVGSFLPGLASVKRRGIFLMLGLLTIVSALAALLLVSFVRLPLAVGIGVGAAVGFALAWLVSQTSESDDGLRFRWQRVLRRLASPLAALLICLSLFFSIFMNNGWLERRGVSRDSEILRTNFLSAFQLQADGRRVVAPGAAGEFFSSNPYRGRDTDLDLPLIAGWTVFSPLWEDRKRLMNLQSDVYSELVASGRGTGFDLSSDKVLLLSDELTAQRTQDFLNDEAGLGGKYLAVPVGSELLPGLYLWQFTETS